jgi:hypothetical protein
MWFRIGASGGHGNKILVSIKGGKFLKQNSDYQLLKKGSALCSALGKKF